LLFADKERVFTQPYVSRSLQLVTSISRNVELYDVVDPQRVISDLVTIAERNLNRSVQPTAAYTYTATTMNNQATQDASAMIEQQIFIFIHH